MKNNCMLWLFSVYLTNFIHHVVSEDIEKLGCWKDSNKNRALTSMEHQHHILDDIYHKRSDPVTKCAQVANDHGYSIFAIQNGGQCFSGSHGDKRYNMYGPSNLCKHGKGGKWSNDVYSTKTFHSRSVHKSMDPSPWDAYCSRDLDVVILLDASGTTSKKNKERWKEMRKFCSKFMKGFDSHARFGIIRYGSEPDIIVDVTKGQSQERITEELKSLDMSGGKRTLNDGLKRAWREQLKEDNRTAADKVVIAMTTGDVPYGLYGSSQFLSDHSVRVIAVGIDKNVHYEFLQSIASYRDVKNIFSVNSEQLQEVAPFIYRDVCNTIPEYVSEPTTTTTTTTPAPPNQNGNNTANNTTVGNTSTEDKGNTSKSEAEKNNSTISNSTSSADKNNSTHRHDIPDIYKKIHDIFPSPSDEMKATKKGAFPRIAGTVFDNSKKKDVVTMIKKGSPKEEVASMVLVNPSPELNLPLSDKETSEISNRRSEDSVNTHNNMLSNANDTTGIDDQNKTITDTERMSNTSQYPTDSIKNSNNSNINPDINTDQNVFSDVGAPNYVDSVKNVLATENNAANDKIPDKQPAVTNSLQELEQNENQKHEDLPLSDSQETSNSDSSQQVKSSNSSTGLEKPLSPTENLNNNDEAKGDHNFNVDNAVPVKDFSSKQKALKAIDTSSHNKDVAKGSKTIGNSLRPSLKLSSDKDVSKFANPLGKMSGTNTKNETSDHEKIQTFSQNIKGVPLNNNETESIQQPSVEEVMQPIVANAQTFNVGEDTKGADSKIAGPGDVSQTVELHQGNGKEHVGVYPEKHVDYKNLFSGKLSDKMKSHEVKHLSPTFSDRAKIQPDSRNRSESIFPTLPLRNITGISNRTTLITDAGKQLAEIYAKVHQVEEVTKDVIKSKLQEISSAENKQSFINNFSGNGESTGIGLQKGGIPTTGPSVFEMDQDNHINRNEIDNLKTVSPTSPPKTQANSSQAHGKTSSNMELSETLPAGQLLTVKENVILNNESSNSLGTGLNENVENATTTLANIVMGLSAKNSREDDTDKTTVPSVITNPLNKNISNQVVSRTNNLLKNNLAIENSAFQRGLKNVGYENNVNLDNHYTKKNELNLDDVSLTESVNTLVGAVEQVSKDAAALSKEEKVNADISLRNEQQLKMKAAYDVSDDAQTRRILQERKNEIDNLLKMLDEEDKKHLTPSQNRNETHQAVESAETRELKHVYNQINDRIHFINTKEAEKKHHLHDLTSNNRFNLNNKPAFRYFNANKKNQNDNLVTGRINIDGESLPFVSEEMGVNNDKVQVNNVFLNKNVNQKASKKFERQNQHIGALDTEAPDFKEDPNANNFVNQPKGSSAISHEHLLKFQPSVITGDDDEKVKPKISALTFYAPHEKSKVGSSLDSKSQSNKINGKSETGKNLSGSNKNNNNKDNNNNNNNKKNKNNNNLNSNIQNNNKKDNNKNSNFNKNNNNNVKNNNKINSLSEANNNKQNTNAPFKVPRFKTSALTIQLDNSKENSNNDKKINYIGLKGGSDISPSRMEKGIGNGKSKFTASNNEINKEGEDMVKKIDKSSKNTQKDNSKNTNSNSENNRNQQTNNNKINKNNNSEEKEKLKKVDNDTYNHNKEILNKISTLVASIKPIDNNKTGSNDKMETSNRKKVEIHNANTDGVKIGNSGNVAQLSNDNKDISKAPLAITTNHSNQTNHAVPLKNSKTTVTRYPSPSRPLLNVTTLPFINPGSFLPMANGHIIPDVPGSSIKSEVSETFMNPNPAPVNILTGKRNGLDKSLSGSKNALINTNGPSIGSFGTEDVLHPPIVSLFMKGSSNRLLPNNAQLRDNVKLPGNVTLELHPEVENVSTFSHLNLNTLSRKDNAPRISKRKHDKPLVPELPNQLRMKPVGSIRPKIDKHPWPLLKPHHPKDFNSIFEHQSKRNVSSELKANPQYSEKAIRKTLNKNSMLLSRNLIWAKEQIAEEHGEVAAQKRNHNHNHFGTWTENDFKPQLGIPMFRSADGKLGLQRKTRKFVGTHQNKGSNQFASTLRKILLATKLKKNLRQHQKHRQTMGKSFVVNTIRNYNKLKNRIKNIESTLASIAPKGGIARKNPTPEVNDDTFEHIQNSEIMKTSHASKKTFMNPIKSRSGQAVTEHDVYGVPNYWGAASNIYPPAKAAYSTGYNRNVPYTNNRNVPLAKTQKSTNSNNAINQIANELYRVRKLYNSRMQGAEANIIKAKNMNLRKRNNTYYENSPKTKSMNTYHDKELDLLNFDTEKPESNWKELVTGQLDKEIVSEDDSFSKKEDGTLSFAKDSKPQNSNRYLFETTPAMSRQIMKNSRKKTNEITEHEILLESDFPRKFSIEEFKLSDLPVLAQGKSYVLSTPTLGFVSVKIRQEEENEDEKDEKAEKDEKDEKDEKAKLYHEIEDLPGEMLLPSSSNHAHGENSVLPNKPAQQHNEYIEGHNVYDTKKESAVVTYIGSPVSRHRNISDSMHLNLLDEHPDDPQILEAIKKGKSSPEYMNQDTVDFHKINTFDPMENQLPKEESTSQLLINNAKSSNVFYNSSDSPSTNAENEDLINMVHSVLKESPQDSKTFLKHTGTSKSVLGNSFTSPYKTKPSNDTDLTILINKIHSLNSQISTASNSSSTESPSSTDNAMNTQEGNKPTADEKVRLQNQDEVNKEISGNKQERINVTPINSALLHSKSQRTKVNYTSPNSEELNTNRTTLAAISGKYDVNNKLNSIFEGDAEPESISTAVIPIPDFMGDFTVSNNTNHVSNRAKVKPNNISSTVKNDTKSNSSQENSILDLMKQNENPVKNKTENIHENITKSNNLFDNSSWGEDSVLPKPNITSNNELNVTKNIIKKNRTVENIMHNNNVINKTNGDKMENNANDSISRNNSTISKSVTARNSTEGVDDHSMSSLEYTLGCHKPLRILYAIDVSEGMGAGTVRQKRWNRLKEFINDINNEVIHNVRHHFMVYNVEPRFMQNLEPCDKDTEYFMTADECLCSKRNSILNRNGCSVNAPTAAENVEDWGTNGPRTGQALERARKSFFAEDLHKYKNVIFLVSHKDSVDSLDKAENDLKQDGISLVDIELGDRHDLKRKRNYIAHAQPKRRSSIEGYAENKITDEHRIKVSLKKLQTTLKNIIGKVCKAKTEEDGRKKSIIHK